MFSSHPVSSPRLIPVSACPGSPAASARAKKRSAKKWRAALAPLIVAAILGLPAAQPAQAYDVYITSQGQWDSYVPTMPAHDVRLAIQTDILTTDATKNVLGSIAMQQTAHYTFTLGADLNVGTFDGSNGNVNVINGHTLTATGLMKIGFTSQIGSGFDTTTVSGRGSTLKVEEGVYIASDALLHVTDGGAVIIAGVAALQLGTSSDPGFKLESRLLLGDDTNNAQVAASTFSAAKLETVSKSIVQVTNGSMTIAGILNLSYDAELRLGDTTSAGKSATIQAGTFSIDGKAYITHGGKVHATVGELSSSGEIRVEGKDSLLEIDNDLTTGGTLFVKDGTVKVGGKIAAAGGTTILRGDAKLLGLLSFSGTNTYLDAEKLVLSKGATLITTFDDPDDVYELKAGQVTVEKEGKLEVAGYGVLTSAGMTTVGGIVKVSTMVPGGAHYTTTGVTVQKGGEVELTGMAALTDKGATTVEGTLTMKGGTYTTTGLTVQGGGVANVSSSAVVQTPDTLVTGAGSTYNFTDNAFGTNMNIGTGTTFRVADGGTVNITGKDSPPRTTTVEGKLTVAGTGSTFNAPDITVQGGGTLTLGEGGQLNTNALIVTGSGSSLVSTANTLSVGTGKVYALKDQAKLDALNVSIDEGGTLSLTGKAAGTVSGKTSITGTGQLNIDATSTYSTDVLALINGGKAHVDEGGILDIKTMLVSGALSSFTLQGDMTLASGKGISVENGAVVTATGKTFVNDGGTLVVGSTAAGDATAIFETSNLTVNAGGSLTLLEGGQLNTAILTVTGSGSTLKSEANTMSVGTGKMYTLMDQAKLDALNVSIATGGRMDLLYGTVANVSGKTSITGTGLLFIDNTSTYSTGSLELINGGKATVAEGGILDIKTMLVSGAQSSFTQAGDMTLASGKGISVEKGAVVTATGKAFVNDGGTLVVGSTAADATATFEATSLTVNAGGSFTLLDAGELKTNTVTVTGDKALFKAQNLAVEAGKTYTVEKAGKLEASSVTLKGGGLLNVAADGNIDSKLFNFSGGTYKGNLTLSDVSAVLNAHADASGTNLVDGKLNVTQGTVNLGTDALAGQLKVTGDVTFGAASTLHVNLAKVAQGANPVLTGAGSNKLNVDKGSLFNITGGTKGSYQISKDFMGGSTAESWASVGTTSSALKVKGEWDSTGQIYTVIVGYTDPIDPPVDPSDPVNPPKPPVDPSDPVNPPKPPVKPLLPGISSPVNDLIISSIKQLGVDPESSNAGHKFYSRALDSRYGGKNSGEAGKALDSAAKMSLLGGGAATSAAASQAGSNAALSRMTLSNPRMDSTRTAALHMDQSGVANVDVSTGLSAGSGLKNGVGLWIAPLYQSNNVWGMDAGGGQQSGYSSDLGGISLGADYTFNDMFRLGLSANMGGGSARSNGDLSETFNRFTFWGLSAYGGWYYNNFGLMGDVGFTSNYGSMELDLPDAFQMADLKADVVSRTWHAGLRGEYKWQTAWMDIIPHVGVRYMGITTDGHDVHSGGSTVHKVEQSFQSIWTFPVGVTFSKDVQTESGWVFKPQLDLGVIPAAGDVKAKSRVSIPGVTGSAQSEMQVMDYMTWEGGLGLEMKKDNFSVGVNYTIQASEHRTGHMVFGTLRYEF